MMTWVSTANIALEVFGCLISLIIIICLTASGLGRRDKPQRLLFLMLVCNIIVLSSDAMAIGFKGGAELHNYIIVRIANFCAFSFGYVLAALVLHYFIAFVQPRQTVPRIVPRVLTAVCAVAILMVVISQFNHMYYTFDENNVYQRQSMFWLSQAFGVVLTISCGAVAIRYCKVLGRRNTLFFLSYSGMVLVAVCIQMFTYGLALLYIASTLSLTIIYIGIQSEQSKLLDKKELELTESRIDIMLSQIQPHFLHNTLNTIENLCYTDAELAAKLIRDFSGYLRENMDSLALKAPVSFERELKHVQTYLNIEKLRFEERLNVVYDFEVTDFELPILTVQPLVENAVRYGVTKRAKGGTITISTRRREHCVEVTITDDGVGFNAQSAVHGERSHVGIANVRERLRAGCGGTLAVQSEKDKGTVCVITIPIEGGTKL